MNNHHITAVRVMTRDGHHLPDAINLIAERRQHSERQQMLASVARIEARLELERALKRGAVPMATPTPIIRQPGAMASRNPGKIHPAPIADNDAASFDRTDGLLAAVVHTLALLAAVMVAVVLAGGVA
jgi:hypothetical protein